MIRILPALFAVALICAPLRAQSEDWVPVPIREAGEIAMVVAEYRDLGPVLFAGLREAGFEPYEFPSSSMYPAIAFGDLVVVRLFDRLPDPAGSLELGDLVVFIDPRQTGCVTRIRAAMGLGEACIAYIKRVVGLPGDAVQMVRGVLHLNGAPVTMIAGGSMIVPGPSPCREPRTENGRPVCDAQIWTEILPNGRSYPVLSLLEAGMLDDTQSMVVPEGHVFVLGDNRDNSADSRLNIGMVPFENLRAYARIALGAGEQRQLRLLR